MWPNPLGEAYAMTNSPNAIGTDRMNNPHFDKDGNPVSEKAKKIAEKTQKVSNDTKQLSRNEAKAANFSKK